MTPPQTTTTDRGEATRRRILDVSAAHFLERGYAGTSLNDVIKASGLTKGGFYFHFASKAELAMESLDAIRSAWHEEILQSAGYHPRAVDQIVAIVRAAASTKLSKPTGTAIGRLCEEIADFPEMAERMKPFDGWFALIADLLGRAQQQGDMDPAIDPAQAAHFAVLAYLGYDQLADVSGDPGLVERFADEYLTFLFRALGISAPIAGLS